MPGTGGACIQTDAFDVDRLSDDVEYLANSTNLDTTMLPVPTLTNTDSPLAP